MRPRIQCYIPKVLEYPWCMLEWRCYLRGSARGSIHLLSEHAQLALPIKTRHTSQVCLACMRSHYY